MSCSERTEKIIKKLVNQIKKEQEHELNHHREAEGLLSQKIENASAKFPVDADNKPCLFGDMVWYDGKPMRVVAITHKGKLNLREYDRNDGRGAKMWVESSCVTHRKPVLYADGVVINVGDVVYRSSPTGGSHVVAQSTPEEIYRGKMYYFLWLDA